MMERVAYFQTASVIKDVSLIFDLTLDRCHSTRQKEKKKEKGKKKIKGCPKRASSRAGVVCAPFLPYPEGCFTCSHSQLKLLL